MMLKLCTYFKWNIVYDIIDRRNDLFLFTKRAQSELIFSFHSRWLNVLLFRLLS